jgi:predicted O-linked N-acetylglucosamine transferase (SPINDLY family)
MATNSEASTLERVLAQAQSARELGQWETAVEIYSKLEQVAPQSAEIKHNLGLTYFAWGKLNEALHWCAHAQILNPKLWQSAIIVAKANKGLGQMEAAWRGYQSVLGDPASDAQARIGLADLAMNQFGDPLLAKSLVAPLVDHPSFAMDAQLTTLMASLYDRDDWDEPGNAQALSDRVREFSAQYLQLPPQNFPPFTDRAGDYADPQYRPKVGLLSPQFCVSPVYFLTIAGWRHVAKNSEIMIFNRGYQQDWATPEFRALASQWINVAHLNATQLAKRLREADLDVLYDLGGWMDAIGLQALSTKPARQVFKWVGGQSVTTGLSSFDGWIGDEAQSPMRLQSLYSEPLIEVPEGYATYTPPSYLPKPQAQKSQTPCVFANPAKVSRAFLAALKEIPGPKVFIHHQYRYSQVQERIRQALGVNAQFVIPTSHQEALQALNAHAVMIDTFPYSSGLTAREALAMGTQVQVLRVGELFCERHTANLVS